MTVSKKNIKKGINLGNTGSGETEIGDIGVDSNGDLRVHDGTSSRIMVNTTKSQTLTNKTLTSPVLTNPSVDNIVTAAATDMNLIPGTSGKVVIKDGTTPTKAIKFDASGITATKTLTIAGSNTTDITLTLPATSSTLMGNPMSAIGQMVYGGASGVPTVLAVGSVGQVLQSNGSAAPTWVNAAGGGNLSGTLTVDYLPIATGATTLADSVLSYSSQTLEFSDAPNGDYVIKPKDRTSGIGNSAGISIKGGNSASTNTGQVNVISGNAATATKTSGPVTVKSGTTTTGTSGTVEVKSGDSTSGTTGDINIATGATSGTRGSINLNGLSTSVTNLSSNGIVTTSGGTGLLGVTATLPLTNGGTAKALTAVAGGIVYTDADSMEVTAAGTSGQVLTSNGASAPTWTTPAAPTTSIVTIGSHSGGFSANASGTYTTPANVKYIRIKMVGGGGSGAGSGVTLQAGAAGTSTTFGTATAGGGAGGPGSVGPGGAGGIATIGTIVGINIVGGMGTAGSGVSTSTTYTTGGNGGSNAMGAGGAGAMSNSTGGSAPVNSGGGGAGAGATNAANSYASAGGGAGGYIEGIIVSPAGTYSYTVGAGDTNSGVASSNGGAGGNGADGFISIEEFYQ